MKAEWVKCTLCTKPVDANATGTCQWTSGWVMRREGGGGHGISLAIRHPQWAHGSCVDREVRGWTNQAEMFGGKHE